MLRKILAGLLTLALLCSALPAGAFAAEGPYEEAEWTDPAPGAETEERTYADYRLGAEAPEEEALRKGTEKSAPTSGSCGSSLQWSFRADSGELTISGTGEMENFTKSNTPWYSVREQIQKVTVQEGVSSLGNYAFYFCLNLTEISLPESLRRIGSFCFQYCKKLTAITLPEGLVSIGQGAFNVADLRSVHLPASLTELNSSAFYGCQNLNEISVAPGNGVYSVADGILYNDVKAQMLLCPANRTGHLVIPSNVKRLTDGALAHCAKLEGVTIPDGMSWESNAFTFCAGFLNVFVYDTNPDYQSLDGVLYTEDLKTLVLFPAGRSGSYTVREGTENIGYAAFCRMNHEIDIILPDSVETIDISAFSFSPGLRNLKLSANLRELYAHAFSGCTNMNNVVLPETLSLLGYSCFKDCESITEISVPSQITVIGRDTFNRCSSLEKVELSDSITAIYDRAFYNCTSLKELKLPKQMETFGIGVFDQCQSLEQIEIPQGVKELPLALLHYCTSLKKVTLPKGLEIIGKDALRSTPIEQLLIPETVRSIDDSAFAWCKELRCIHFLGDAPAIEGGTLQYVPEDLLLCYTEGAKGWSEGTWNEMATALWSYDYTTTATCTLSGVECFRCKHCSLEFSRTVAAYGHSFGQWSLEKYPTQEQEGHWIRSCCVCGAEEQEIIPVLLPAAQEALVSSNRNGQNYIDVAQTVKSYLVENADGTLSRVEAAGDYVYIEQYSADFQLMEVRKVAMELPIFGGFYEGETDYFLVFGQENLQESDSCEVVRVVRYSKDWLRKGQSSLYGANTVRPFDAGSLRMTQYGDMLYVHSCHKMYKSYDGLNHQANMIFSVYLPDMVISDQYTVVANPLYGYVSHSFNQFVLTDGDKLLTLNHGDGYPRAAVIMEYSKPAGELEFTGQCQYTSVLNFYGAIGYNATGASLGAFERSNSAYLVAGNSTAQNETAGYRGQRNIFLGVAPRGSIGTNSSTLRWITDYGNDAGVTVSTPHLVKLGDNRFLLLWTENGSLRYVFVDGQGVETSRIYEAEAALSDCKPIVYGGRVCWYVTRNSAPVFYAIDPEQPERVEETLPPEDELPPEEGTCDGGIHCPSHGFRDVAGPEDWSHEGIDFVITRGLFNGTSGSTFEPESEMTRAMLVTVLWRYAGSPEAGSNGFTDVPAGSWYTQAVAWAAEQGVVNGVGGGRFEPEGEITREQLATILYRYVSGIGIATEARTGLAQFPDAGETSEYAVTAMQWAVAEGLISGSREGSSVYLDPQGSATRAQVATILMRLIENILE